MAGTSIAGLASGFDWQTLVNQLITAESTPITTMQAQQTKNTGQSVAMQTLGTDLSSLQTAVTNLQDPALFSGRLATSSLTGSAWAFTASAGVPTGGYQFAVSQVATKAQRTGADGITAGLVPTADVTGLTLAALHTTSPVTAGTFTINGTPVTVATTDSLQQVFDAITAATGGDVTGTYDPATDKVSLTSAGNHEIVLGAANDSSNFLQTLKLTNTGTGAVTSFGKLAAIQPGLTLAQAGLTHALTAVDASGNGSLTVNGTSISYNVNNDTLDAVLARITASKAGVTASYDSINDRVSLANNSTGDVGINLAEPSGGLLDALGLTTGATTVRGLNAKFSINGGPTVISTSNTLDGSLTGIGGLSVTVTDATTQTINVAADTAKMTSQINNFVSAYNTVQSFIASQTQITSSGGKVTTSVLSSNHDVQNWATNLRSLAFGAIAGLGSVGSLNDLGLDMDVTGQLSVKDSTQLGNALANHPNDVEAFFNTAGTGFAARMNTQLTALIKNDTDAQAQLTKTNADLDTQIATVQARLDQDRTNLTNSFIAMETAQANLKTQSQALTAAFGGSNTTSSVGTASSLSKTT